MSFARSIYWTGLLGGWSAFVAWLFCEILFGRWINDGGFVGLALAVLMGTLVAAAIGGGLSQAPGLVHFRWQEQLPRLALGLVGGLVGGLIGSLIGNAVFAIVGSIPFLGFLGRLLGWTILGAAVGVVEGVYTRSFRTFRNGLIGGMLGGFLGGLFFNPLSWLIGSPMSSRAIGFVLLGLFVGLLVGLVQVVLKEAWVTVEAGFRTGRQMILSRDETTMGTSEKAGLIFIAYGAKGVEPIHLRIARNVEGAFVLHDNNTRGGTFVNGAKVDAPTVLHNGDTIQLGVNVVRFNERFRSKDAAREPLPQSSRPVSTIPAATLLPPRVPATPAARLQPAPVAASTPAVTRPPQTTPPVRPTVPPPASVTASAVHQAPPPRVPAVAAQPAARVAPAPAPSAPAVTVCPICGSRAIKVDAGKQRCGDCFTVLS